MGLLGLTTQPLASQVIHNYQVAPSASSFRKQIFHKFPELYQLPHYFNESHTLFYPAASFALMSCLPLSSSKSFASSR